MDTDDEVQSATSPLEEIVVDEHPGAVVPPDPRGLAGQLPYTGMDWPDFEKLVKLVMSRQDWQQVRIYGEPGQTQYGIDVIGLQPDGTWGSVQTKKYQTFDEADFAAAVKKFDPARLPIKGISRLIIATSVHTNRRQILDTKATLQADCEVKLEFWDGSDLDAALRRHADLVAEFFGMQAATDFCGLPPRLVEPPAPEHAVVADLIMRGPAKHADVKANLAQAQAAEATDPGAAADAYARAQDLLREAQFGPYARAWDEAIAKNLTAAGRYRDAAIALANAYWAAVRDAERDEAQIVANRLETLGQTTPAEVADQASVARIARIVTIAEQLDSTPLGGVDQILPGLDLPALTAGFEDDPVVVGYVAELAVVLAQTALSNPMDTWARDNVASLREIRGRVNDEIGGPPAPAQVGVRLDIEIAAATEEWTRLLSEVRTREHDRGVCALISRASRWPGR